MVLGVLTFILILIALILVHELGHFVVAKFFKVRVDEFSIGFPPRLFSRQWGETRYSFGALLLGGYVNIYGERPGEGVGERRSLNSRPRPVQAAIVVAGVVCNILLAWLAFSLGYMAGLPTSAAHEGWGSVTNARPTIVGVLPESPAAQSGLTAGDVVVALQTGTAEFNLRTVSMDRQAALVRNFIAEHEDESIIFTVQRGADEETYLAKAEEGVVAGRKAVGIEIDDLGTLRLPPHLALLEGASLTARVTVATAQGLASFFATIFRGAADFSSVAGPIGIATIGATAVGQGYAEAILLTALISINLALINLIPIPGLDGGRLLIIAVEGMMRRPVPERLTTALTLLGFALLILLMIVVSFHDIARLAS